MKIVKQFEGGVTVLETPRFDDSRGSFAIPFEAGSALASGVPDYFVQDNHSTSVAVGTIRGLHLQLPPWEQGKLIRVLRGRVYDVFVDLRPTAPTRGSFNAVELSAADDRLLWIPPGFAHGFCTLEPDTEVFYKVDVPYNQAAEVSLDWNDPTIAVKWPVEPDQAVLSDKDRQGKTLTEVLEAYDEGLGGG